ncbi:MAG: SpoIIE family protein phosphatase [bacterium]|nr:SpoIIE family protein phosphatase [bacterium]
MKKIITALLLVLVSSVLTGNQSIRFKHISLNDGLSQNSVYCIFQDSKGFLWFGTQDGLNKYDGYSFKVYKNDPDNKNSISSNWVTNIGEDSIGNLWIALRNGDLNRFDPVTETFEFQQLEMHLPPNSPRPIIFEITTDDSGRTWFGSARQGLFQLVRTNIPGSPGKVKEEFFNYRLNENDKNSLSHNRVSGIHCAGGGILWIATGNGLNKLDTSNGKMAFTHYYNDPEDPESLSGNALTTLCAGTSGTLWVGTARQGLNLFDPETGKARCYQFDPDNPRSLSGNFVPGVLEDESGVLWVTTRRGLNRFDKRSETFTRYERNNTIPYSLSSNALSVIYEDRSRVLWLGTLGGGLNKFDRHHKFNEYKLDGFKKSPFRTNFVNAIYQDRYGYLWVGSDREGLAVIERSTNSIRQYRRVPDQADGIAGNTITRILEDRTGTVWVGTETGLCKYNRETDGFTTYRNIPMNPQSLSDNLVRNMTMDGAGNLWVGTRVALDRFNPEDRTFTHYLTNAERRGGLGLYAIYESPSRPGILWLGDIDTGLYRLDTKTGKYLRYVADRNKPFHLSNNTVMAVHEDSSGTLWVATYGGGLNKAMRGKDGSIKFMHFTETHGLANNSIYGILEDHRGFLWMSTNKGLSRFDPKTVEFKNYNVKDGLQGNEFNSGAYFKSKNDEFFFGGLDGFNSFYPKLIRTNSYKPQLAITDLKILGRAENDTLPTPYISKSDTLTLSYKHNTFRFQFAALDYTTSESNLYSYKMEGVNSEWIYTDASDRSASYTNLEPGNYKFRVRGSNNDGIWNNTGLTVDVTVLPPFWKTLWFQSLIFLLLLYLFFLWYRRRLKTVRIRTELQTARDAQMSIMPQHDPEISNYSISGTCVPANEVGGDFFDYIWMDDEKTKLGIAIGDVSGKAMKSAMTAVMTSGMIYLETDISSSVREIMQRVNRPLYFKTGKTVFTALCLASLEIASREITYVNAGLNDPLIKSGNQVSSLRSVGAKLPLGVKADSEYMENSVSLKTGDVVILFTDGITEAKNPYMKFYHLSSLIRFMEKLDMTDLSAAQIKEYIIADVAKFSHGAPQHDDIAIVVVKAV